MYLLIGVESYRTYASAHYKSELNCTILNKWPNRDAGVGSRLSGQKLSKSKFAVPFPEAMRIVKTNRRDAP